MRDHKIIASLTYGKRCTVGLFLVMVVGAMFCTALVPLTIILTVITDKYGVLFCLFIPLIGIPALYQTVYINWRQLRDIKKWKADAEMITGRAEETDRIVNRITRTEKIQIILTFPYGERDIMRVSGGKNTYKQNIFYLHPGYSSIFLKYIKRPINILYSQKYDEVMILED